MKPDQIKQISRARYQYQLAKLAAKENHTAQLLITTNGTTIRVTSELIAFLSVDLGDESVVMDIYDNPVKVSRLDLLEQASTTYTQVMNSWADAVATINKQR